MERIDMIQAVQTVKQPQSSTSSDRKDTGFTQLLKEKGQAAADKTEKPESIGKRPVQKDEAGEADQNNDLFEDQAVLAQGIPVWGMQSQILAEAMLKLGTENAGQELSGIQPILMNTDLDVTETGSEHAAGQDAVMEVMQQHTEAEETTGEQQTAASDVMFETTQESQPLSEELLQAAIEEPEPEPEISGSKLAGLDENGSVRNVVSEAEQPAVPVIKAASAKEPQTQQGQSETSHEEGAKMAAQSEQPVVYRTYGTAEQRSPETIPVKTQPETLPEDVGEALAARFPQKNGQLTIDLEPASLGKITVKVMYEAGRAEVSIMANNPKTLELLSKNAGDIAGILQEKTGQETVVYTQQPNPQYGQEQNGAENGGQRQNHQEPKERKNQQQDSFAQQLRLGLV